MTGPRLLIMDDDQAYCGDLSLIFSDRMQVATAFTGEDGLAQLERAGADVVLLDVDFGPGRLTGLQILERIGILDDPPTVIMLSGNRDLPTVVEAVKLGAFHYVAKPANPSELRNLVVKALGARLHRLEKMALQQEVGRLTGSFIAGDDKTFRMLERVDQVASTPVNVMITGESGTGKEMVARRIHAGSSQVGGPFVGINCGAFPPDLIESEIFGHARGAFSGALQPKPGKFELAAGGTLFLDEVGEGPLPFQVKLLRALGEKVFTRLGDNQDIPVQARILAATSRDLSEAMALGTFREDLYYRLNTYRIEILPLRKRPGDIMPLARHFLAQAVRDFGKRVDDFSPAVEMRLEQLPWPGNVRELKNVVECAVINCRASMIDLGDLSGPADSPSESLDGPWSEAKSTMILRWEKDYFTARLQATAGNVSQAAKHSGMTRQHFQNKLRELGLVADDFRS
ncbi:MAG: sigma-54 dependent transcriptional regulator [bacterium]